MKIEMSYSAFKTLEKCAKKYSLTKAIGEKELKTDLMQKGCDLEDELYATLLTKNFDEFSKKYSRLYEVIKEYSEIKTQFEIKHEDENFFWSAHIDILLKKSDSLCIIDVKKHHLPNSFDQLYLYAALALKKYTETTYLTLAFYSIQRNFILTLSLSRQQIELWFDDFSKKALDLYENQKS